MNYYHGAGLILMAVGVLYLVKPNIYRRGIWNETSVAIRTLSPAQYVNYMRGLGVLFLLIGVGFVAYGFSV
jgi:hypothetical protein